MRFNPLIGLLGLFGPAIAAIVVSAATEGLPGVRALLSRVVRWRVPVPWYLVALGLPAAWRCWRPPLGWFGSAVLQLGGLSALDLVLLVLVVGEELGWRGYALPRLRSGCRRWRQPDPRDGLGAVAPADVLHRGTPQFRQPIVAFLIMTTAYSILMTWIFLHTRGNFLIATLLHGAINLSQGFFLAGTDPASRYCWLALAYGAAAVVLAVGSDLGCPGAGPRPWRAPPVTTRGCESCSAAFRLSEGGRLLSVLVVVLSLWALHWRSAR